MERWCSREGRARCRCCRRSSRSSSSSQLPQFRPFNFQTRLWPQATVNGPKGGFFYSFILLSSRKSVLNGKVIGHRLRQRILHFYYSRLVRRLSILTRLSLFHDRKKRFFKTLSYHQSVPSSRLDNKKYFLVGDLQEISATWLYVSTGKNKS